jgi:hypothetical protein
MMSSSNPKAVSPRTEPEAGGVEKAAEGGDQRREEEEHGLHAGDVQAGEAGDLGVGADHDDLTSEGGAVEGHAEEEEEGEEKEDREGDRADQALLAEVGEPLREVAERVVLDEDPGEATEADQHGQRDDEGRDADAGDEDGVDGIPATRPAARQMRMARPPACPRSRGSRRARRRGP